MFKSLVAQNLEVREVQYHHTINMHATLGGMLDSLGDDDDSMATQVMQKLIPQNDSYTSSLYFNQEKALMKFSESENKGLLGNFMNDFPLTYTMVDRISQKAIVLYFSEKGNFKTESPMEISGKLELIQEEKIILGYVCRKAIWKLENQAPYVVWYTPELHAGFSPIGYVPVEGLVLAAASETSTCIATDVQTSVWPTDLSDLESFELVTEEEVNERIFELTKENFKLFDFIDSAMEVRDEIERGKN